MLGFVNRLARINCGVGLGLEIPCLYIFYGCRTYIDGLKTLL